MGRNCFWEIIARSRAGADPEHPDGNMDRQVARLTELLGALTPSEVVDRTYFLVFAIGAWLWQVYAVVAGSVLVALLLHWWLREAWFRPMLEVLRAIG